MTHRITTDAVSKLQSRVAIVLACVGVWAAVLATMPAAWACASCGSGGDDPLILSPAERVKVYIGASRTGGYQHLTADGEPGFASGPVAKDAFVLSLGKSLWGQSFVTVTMPLVRNVGASDSTWGVGDPLLAARWTVLPQTFVAPWTPQVQLVAGFRPAFANAARDSVDGERLDVFGAGYQEARSGVDVWWGMFDWKFGAALTGLFPFPQAWYEDTMQPGMIVRATCTVGYGRAPYGRIVGGVVREDQFHAYLNGQSVAQSEHTLHALFLTGDATLTDDDTLRLSYSRAGAFLSSNVSRADVMSLAYMRAW